MKRSPQGYSLYLPQVYNLSTRFVTYFPFRDFVYTANCYMDNVMDVMDVLRAIRKKISKQIYFWIHDQWTLYW